uniref:Uncharacterized protein n=2 Tax=Arundo donax TaxID=35708 RepID=A0A0A9HRV3_ARUDO
MAGYQSPVRGWRLKEGTWRVWPMRRPR